MRKSDIAICEQQRCRAACASTQSDQYLCCSLHSIISLLSLPTISSLYLASVSAQTESTLVGNPEDRFSRHEAQILSERELSFNCVVLIPARAKSSARILERAYVRSAEYTTGICFEFAKNTKAFE